MSTVTQRMVIDAQRREELAERLSAVVQRTNFPWTPKGILPEDETQRAAIFDSADRTRGDVWVASNGDAIVFNGKEWVNQGAAYIFERDLAVPAGRIAGLPASELILDVSSNSCLSVDAFGGIVPSLLISGDMTEVDPILEDIHRHFSSTLHLGDGSIPAQETIDVGRSPHGVCVSE